MKTLITVLIAMILLASCTSTKVVTVTDRFGQQYKDTIYFKTRIKESELAQRRYELKWYREHNQKPPLNEKASLWNRTYSKD